MQKRNRLRVFYSDKGIANFLSEHIEINRHLKDNKLLRDYIVKHELGHSDSFDLGHEFKDGFYLIKHPTVLKELIKFIFTHPSTWVDFCPVKIEKKKILYDLNLILLYSMSIALFIFIYKIL